MSGMDRKSRLIFAGDSITDADHLWDPGPDRLGHGYVQRIMNLFREQTGEIKLPVSIINSGFNGFRAEDLLRRWYGSVVSKKPDLVTLLVGVNEAGAAAEGMVTSPEEFEGHYSQLIRSTLEDTGADMILMEPFLFSKPAYLITWRPYFNSILEVIGNLADRYDLPLIKLDGPLNDLASRLGEDCLTVDGIHLTEDGEIYLADQWMKLFNEYYTII